jgi:hypothetical protein
MGAPYIRADPIRGFLDADGGLSGESQNCAAWLRKGASDGVEFNDKSELRAARARYVIQRAVRMPISARAVCRYFDGVSQQAAPRHFALTARVS